MVAGEVGKCIRPINTNLVEIKVLEVALFDVTRQLLLAPGRDKDFTKIIYSTKQGF